MTAHQRQLGKQCRKNAEQRFGHGWQMIGPDLQEMAIAREVVTVLLMLQTGEREDKGLAHAQAIATAALNYA